MDKQNIRIHLRAYDNKILDLSTIEIVNTAKRTGAQVRGPIPLPTKKEIFTVLRSPHIDKKSREQFETNLFGHIELINLFIPFMRKQNEGRIIFNSSVLGLVSFPFSSAYNATKFAMEAFARSLRLELKKTNIKVSLIEPGPIEANFNINALKNLKRVKINNSVYKNKYYKMMKFLANGRGFFTLPALSVAKKVHIALKSKKPKTQYFVTLPTYVLSYLRILPNPIFENFLSLLDNQRKNK